jgi:hypothetical protein
MNDQKWLSIIKKVVHQGYELPKVVEYHQKSFADSGRSAGASLLPVTGIKKKQVSRLSSLQLVRT